MVNEIFVDLLHKYRCLVDPTDPCNGLIKYRRMCQEALLKDLNLVSSYQFDMQDVKRMVKSYQQRLRRKKLKETMPRIIDIRSLSPLSSLASTSDTGVHILYTDVKSEPGVVSEEVDIPHTDVKSEPGVVSEEVDIPHTDVKSEPGVVSEEVDVPHTDVKSEPGVVLEEVDIPHTYVKSEPGVVSNEVDIPHTDVKSELGVVSEEVDIPHTDVKSEPGVVLEVVDLTSDVEVKCEQNSDEEMSDKNS